MDHPGPRLAQSLLEAYTQLVDAAVAELSRQGYGDVRPGHHYAMQAIDDGAESASELGRRTQVTKQSALRTVSVLIERGWVTREPDPRDGRRMRLRVTDLGHAVTAAGAAIFDDLRRAWERELGPETLGALESTLARLATEAPPST